MKMADLIKALEGSIVTRRGVIVNVDTVNAAIEALRRERH
jgi:hypothetical protein